MHLQPHGMGISDKAGRAGGIQIPCSIKGDNEPLLRPHPFGVRDDLSQRRHLLIGERPALASTSYGLPSIQSSWTSRIRVIVFNLRRLLISKDWMKT